MNQYHHEISNKLALIADRVIFNRGAVTARRAYYPLPKMHPDDFAQAVADALGMPRVRDHFHLVDGGDHRPGRYIWAAFQIEDYRNEMVRAKVERDTNPPRGVSPTIADIFKSWSKLGLK